jgi:Protein of unknown function (DUF1091)
VINNMKLKANKYRKNLYDHTFDYCQFVEGAENPIIKTFAPDLIGKLGDLYRPCPISVSFKLFPCFNF